MKAFIEYPEGRFEVTSELVVKSAAVQFDDDLDLGAPVELEVNLNRAVYGEYWKDEC